MKRRLATIFASLMLALSWTGVAAAGNFHTLGGDSVLDNCDLAKITLWENTGYNGNGLAICYGFNVPDLATYGFNNITSSAVYVKGTVTTNACLYDLINYNQTNPFAWKEQYGSDNESHQYFLGGDRASSVKWLSGC